MLKILQARLQQYMNCELPDVQAAFRKGRGIRDQIANIHWIMKKQESSRKKSISALLTITKLLTLQITINFGKVFKRWEYQTTWPASWETYMQVRKSFLQHHSSKAPILWPSALFTVQLSHPYMTTGKTIALTRWIFVGKVMSLLLNMLSRLVITFLPRSKRLLISWLHHHL